MLAIDLVSDFSCPWCFIGARRLARVLAEPHPATAGGVQLTHHPYLLNPTLPPEGTDLRRYLQTRYGGDPEAMFARVEAAAHDAGIPLDFAKIRRFPNTVAAHTLVRLAPTPAAAHALADALFSAYFLEGQDIGATDVLVDLASRHGFTPDQASRLVQDPGEREATLEAAAGLAAQGIEGVPFFVFNRRLALSGAQPESTFRDALAQAVA